MFELIFAGLISGVILGIFMGVASVMTTTVCDRCRQTYSKNSLRCPHCGHLPANR
jgi:ribosomal protein L37E